jgi:hypothetical protein
LSSATRYRSLGKGSAAIRRKRHPIEDLRTAIDCLPVETRVAMLHGVRSNDIIVGAYTDRRGGVCPMLAAHRCGGRTSFLSFARSWDRFTGAKNRARRATQRELRVLVTHLEASLLAEERYDLRDDLGAAIEDHRRLVADRRRASTAEEPKRRRPGDPDRAPELSERAGWAWLRPFRRFDDYARAMERVEAERAALAEAEPEDQGTPVGA